MEKINRRLFYIYRNWYYLWVELSGWMGSVSYGLGADLSLPPCLLVTIGIWTLAHKSDPRAEISGEIVWYDALAPRPEVLLSWYFVCACAGYVYSWEWNELRRVKWIQWWQRLRHLLVPVSSTRGRISHLLGWSEFRFQNRPFCNHFALQFGFI